MLQALATQEVFRELGCIVDFINYDKNGKLSYLDRAHSFTQGKGFLAKLLYPLILIPSFIKEDKVFKAFIKKYLNQQVKEYSCMDEFKDFPNTSDIY